MRLTFLFCLAIPLLGACASGSSPDGDDDNDELTEEEFAEDFTERYCDAHASCNAHEECSVTTGADSDDCDFDAEAAQACLGGEYACDDSLGEGLEFVVPPEACASVC